jgi:PST family polysaccharide transporter
MIYSLGFLLSGILSIWIVLESFKVRIYNPPLNALIKYLKDSSQFFLSRVSVSLYTISNTFFIGLFLGNKFAGFYSAAEKIFIALTLLYQPLIDALYPLMSRRKNVQLFKRIFSFTIIVNTILCITLFIMSPALIKLLYGKGFDVSAILFRIFSI